MTDDDLKAQRAQLQRGIEQGDDVADHVTLAGVVAIIDEALSRGRETFEALEKLRIAQADYRILVRTLAENERERDEARAALAKQEAYTATVADRLAIVARELESERAVLTEANNAFERLVALNAKEVANARAVAFEEAKRFFNDAPKSRYFFPEQIVQQFQALSQTPPSGQWVAADVMERARRHLRGALMVPDPRKSIPQHAFCQEVFMRLNDAILDALSALESEASR